MSYKDLIIEGIPSGNDAHAPPLLPEEYRSEYISSIPRIPVPNDKFVFYLRAKEPVATRLLADPRVKPQIIAESWTDLFFGSYPYWDWVFDFEVTESNSGEPYRVRRKLAQVSDQEIHGVWVPGVFAGDEVPNLPIPQFVITGFQRLRRDTQLVLPTVERINEALLRRIRDNPAELHNLKPRQFEELICDLLTKMGWQLELTPASKDGGYDIFGFSGSTGGVRSNWIIECKKYAPERKVGVEIVRSLCGVKEELKAANAMIVTTSSFTRGARDISRRRWDITLKDQEAILDWANEVASR